MIGFGLGFLVSSWFLVSSDQLSSDQLQSDPITLSTPAPLAAFTQPVPLPLLANGRPQLSPLPVAQADWQCEVVVVGGSLGGVAAAAHAMQAGAITCLIELTPWLGGQISSQGVSAIDESLLMWQQGTFSPSWMSFKALIEQQTVKLPSWVPLKSEQRVGDLNSCWVGRLCFSPQAGAAAAQKTAEGRFG